MTFFLLFVGVLLGGIVSFVVAMVVSYWQFISSTAGYRVAQAVEATQKLALNREKHIDSVSTLRNQYRYSLGVIVDEFVQGFGVNGDFKHNGPWPSLICPHSDRWKKFREQVRPVIEDINVYSFLGERPLPFAYPPVAQLCALTKLCNQVETVVGLLDGALEKKLVRINCAKNEVTNVEVDILDAERQEKKRYQETLAEAYRELQRRWDKWLRTSQRTH
jgi:hypothetical protein